MKLKKNKKLTYFQRRKKEKLIGIDTVFLIMTQQQQRKELFKRENVFGGYKGVCNFFREEKTTCKEIFIKKTKSWGQRKDRYLL